ncbi:MAG: transketolase family protein [Treponema sp.]|jgi:transketolase|nr:transketolase family protein [Treponema sp.]
MYEQIEMRTVFAEHLKKAMTADKNVILLDADLARANGTLNLFSEFPEQTFDVGVAEANMACIAAGLSSYGFKPFIFSFACFVTRRVCDQLMLSIAYAKQNVKIVGTDPGIGAELNGGTHMTFEDVGVLRSIPGMVIYEPVDGDQLAKAIPQILEYEGPLYIRLFRKVPPASWFGAEDYRFNLFTADMLLEGKDVTLFATGIEVTQAMEAAKLLAAEGIRAEVINIHTIKPVDVRSVVESVKKTGCAVVCENHNIIGGLGSAVAEVLVAGFPAPLGFIGAKDQFAEVGKIPYLIKEFGLDAESIFKEAKSVMGRKS